jgi:hypothetical protein
LLVSRGGDRGVPLLLADRVVAARAGGRHLCVPITYATRRSSWVTPPARSHDDDAISVLGRLGVVGWSSMGRTELGVLCAVPERASRSPAGGYRAGVNGLRFGSSVQRPGVQFDPVAVDDDNAGDVGSGGDEAIAEGGKQRSRSPARAGRRGSAAGRGGLGGGCQDQLRPFALRELFFQPVEPPSELFREYYSRCFTLSGFLMPAA